MTAKTPKGDISIENFRGFIRLRWRYQGHRASLSLGLPYDPVNVAIAQVKATQIRLDLLSGNYDPSLAKYRSDRTSAPPAAIGAVDLFDQFIEWKAKQVQPRTLEKYYALAIWLKDEFGDRPVAVEDAEKFLARLLDNMEPITARERLALLNAAWNWAETQGMVEGNPWAILKVRKPPKPFTKAEVPRSLAIALGH